MQGAWPSRAIREIWEAGRELRVIKGLPVDPTARDDLPTGSLDPGRERCVPTAWYRDGDGPVAQCYGRWA
jgi:hypothetical protein